ncbi:DUF5719 family protein [Microlunatus ginsengisoli]|uniref:Uncharacterized protein n=1 Tax=Microlunatus ginsengisoli TaxID=363863 RepID=A0ABP6ZEZ9_9ACTN
MSPDRRDRDPLDPDDEMAFDPGADDDADLDEIGDGTGRGSRGSRGSGRSGRGRTRSPADDDADGVDDWGTTRRARRRFPVSGRHVLAVAVVLVVAVAIVVGGSLLPTQRARTVVSAAPLVGRTTSVCPAAFQDSADAADRPAATVSAVTIRSAPDRQGVLTGTLLAGGEPLLTVKQQGFGAQVKAPDAPLLLQATGAMSTASSGAILASADTGELTGLSAAPCTSPSTSQWFVGVGAETTNRTELVLSNPDDAQAEVDLRFFGQSGRVVVPGSPGLVVPAHASRTVSLESLVAQTGPLSVWVRATSGRVSAMARDLRSVGLTPAGADWHPASIGPRRALVVPGVPAGAGARQLQLVNPSMTRALVTVSVLGATGAFSPVGAEQVEVPPESTVSASLDPGLAGQGAGIGLAADRPVSAAVVSTSSGTDADTGSAALPDIAVQPATPAVGRHGVGAIAAVTGTDGTLMLSNGGDTDTRVGFTIANLSGVTLRSDTMLVPAHGTSTRRLDPAAGASYVQVDVPDGALIYGAADFAQSEGPVAGLTSLPITSPDLASRSRDAVPDPAVGR